METRPSQVFNPAAIQVLSSTEPKNPFVVAPCAVALATAIRLALDPLIPAHDPFLFYAIAVVIAALFGGARAGIGATVLSIPFSDYLFIAPRHTWFIYDAPGDSIMLLLFAILGVLTTVIVHRFQGTRRELRRSLIELQQSESKLEMIAATVPEILFIAAGDGTIEYLNGHCGEYSGRKLPALLGHGWLDLVHPDDRPKLEEARSKGLEERSEFQTNIRLRRSDGAYRWFKWHAKPVLDPDGLVRKWFGVCSDIDNEKTLTAALESRTQDLQRLSESMERFAYSASHDLQEPLRTIGSMTQLFLTRSGGKLDPESSDLIGLVLKDIDRMKRLIHDIMEFAKASNTFRIENAAVDTHAVAELAIENLGEAIARTEASVVLDRLPVIYADESAMLRLFQNLIANAIKYHGENIPKVYVSASHEGEEWVFSIRDNGIGIDPQYHDRIFEPFRRLHGRAQYEGSGLGLSSCQRIVESLNGRIWVKSAAGSGSTFFFAIPEHAGREGGERKAPGMETAGANRLFPGSHRTASGR